MGQLLLLLSGLNRIAFIGLRFINILWLYARVKFYVDVWNVDEAQLAVIVSCDDELLPPQCFWTKTAGSHSPELIQGEN